jgi:hypothetical protein
MARPLKKREVVLPNGVSLESLPITKSKGRHWQARQDGELVGEFITWQQTTYTRQKDGDYGRGGGSYHTTMIRQSWLRHLDEKAEDPNTERQFYEWKKLVRAIPHPAVKKIA